MYTPHSLDIALLMMVTSAVCWGSWANTYKGVKNYRFELFYWDYAVGIFLISVIFAFTLGSTSNDANSFLNNIHSADTSNMVSVMVGGAIFNLANLLLVEAIDMAGLAVAFPISIGIALVVGVVSSFILQPRGNPGLLPTHVIDFHLPVLQRQAFGRNLVQPVVASRALFQNGKQTRASGRLQFRDAHETRIRGLMIAYEMSTIRLTSTNTIVTKRIPPWRTG